MHFLVSTNLLRFSTIISLLGKCDNNCNKNINKNPIIENKSDFTINSMNNNLRQLTPDLSVYLISWNIKSELPKCDLTQLFDIPADGTDGSADARNKTAVPLADIYVIGLQEVPIRAANILFTDPWIESFDKLFKQLDYIRLKYIKLVGVLLIVYTRRQYLPKVRSIETQYTRTGFGGLWGNKGGVSVSVIVDGISICLVNSHLAAHYEHLDQRISDYNAIVEDQYFVNNRKPTILSHDYVIWIGDLNFRIDELNGDQIHDIIQNAKHSTNGHQNNPYSELLNRDQLNRVRREGLAFSEFTETEPTFAPTYKFYVNTDDYDYKSRKPAFTDRILYRFTPNAYNDIKLDLRQIQYKSHPQYKQSDHKPVSALFHLKTKKSFARRFRHRRQASLGVEPIVGVAQGLDEPDVSDTQIDVTFRPITHWRVNRDSTAWYTITPNDDLSIAQLSQWDWIGLYKSDFMSIDEHLAFVWANPVPSRWSPPPVQSGNSTSSSDDESSGQTADSATATAPEPWFSVQYSDQSLLIANQFRLVYITQNGDVLGISETFFVSD